MRWHVHEDFVSGLTHDRARSCLLSVSGDSTLGSMRVRNNVIIKRMLITVMTLQLYTT